MNMTDFFEKVDCIKIENGWVLASLTDKYIVDKWPMENNDYIKIIDDERKKKEIEKCKILEIRVFNKNNEAKLSRTDMGKDFAYRVICDKGNDDLNGNDQKEESFDEIQYLDIDTSKGKDEHGNVTTTGGGKYYLPFEKINDAKIRIRYYIEKYEETGQVVIKDWRAVELIEGV